MNPSVGGMDREDGRAVVRLHAAGSLRAALGDIARAFTAKSGIAVEATFGPSGLLRERISRGELSDILASADMAQPEALWLEGKAGPPVLFAWNRLSVLVRPGLALSSRTVLEAMLDPAIRLGTSTPGSDPSGDYAWEMFERVDAVKAGSGDMLRAKALKLTGGPASIAPPPGRNPYAWHLAEGRADVFLAYRTMGRHVVAELPGSSIVELPEDLVVTASCGLTVIGAAGTEAAASFALFILSQEGQRTLAGHGFGAPTLLPTGR